MGPRKEEEKGSQMGQKQANCMCVGCEWGTQERLRYL